MVKALIFDIGGVLIDNPWPVMVDTYIQHLNIDRQKFLLAFDEVVAEWQSGTLSEATFWQKMSQELQTSLPRSETLWLDGFKAAYKEKDQVFALIAKLKKKGYKIAILSNTEVPVMEFLIEKKYPHFDVFIYSCGENCIKPNKEIYHKTLAQLAVQPEEAIFIDDKEENVAGAKKVGIHGVLFEDPNQLERVFKELLIIQ